MMRGPSITKLHNLIIQKSTLFILIKFNKNTYKAQQKKMISRQTYIDIYRDERTYVIDLELSSPYCPFISILIFLPRKKIHFLN